MEGAGKELRAQLFLLRVSDHQRPELACVEIRARDFSIELQPITLHVNRHAMARVIQSTRCAWLGELRQCFSRVMKSALTILIDQRHLLSPDMTLHIATNDGLFIWAVHEDRCNSGIGMTLKTFIAEHVLDGHNRVIYRRLMQRDSDDRYALTRKRHLNG